MTLITLSFTPEMEEAIFQGRKCTTIRDEWKGSRGDLFLVRDRLYRIILIEDIVYPKELYEFKQTDGYESITKYYADIKSFYPGLKDGDFVSVHFFAYFCDVCQDFNLGCRSCIPEFCSASEVCNHG
jgi:hypothetical protein